MLVAYLIVILVNVIIITLGLKLGCMLIRSEMPWSGAVLIAGITTAASIIPYVGIFAGVIALFICLVTIAQLDFWPESVMVTIIIKAVSIAATLAIFVALK